MTSHAELRKVRKVLTELEKVRGRHTELVSVYVPAGYDINKIIQHLAQEQGTATNIKDARTRNNVIDSLERAIRLLRGYPQTPKNGIAVFAGNASEQENKIDIKVWGVEPPEPISFRTYRCDQTFLTHPLHEMLEHKEVFGLLVLDRREATLGLLKGTKVTALANITSGVPGKTKAGGQCLAPDTLIMKNNGEIIEIKDSYDPELKNTLMVVAENFTKEIGETTAIVASWENHKELYEIITTYPRVSIKASADHTFFVRTEIGIEEKPLSELAEGDYLLMPEKISLNLTAQKIIFKPQVKRPKAMKNVFIPEVLDSSFARILGYFLGDGHSEIDRICFSEEREELAQYYLGQIESYFGVKGRKRLRENKGYYEVRVGSRILSQLFITIIPQTEKTLKGEIPQIVLRSPDNVLASFIAGFFDAEGYVKGRVAIGVHNKKIIDQLQLALLRLGIISSVSIYDNKNNPYSSKPRHIISIDDTESLKKFQKIMNFTAKDKQEKLETLISKRSNRNKVRQLVVNGKEVAKVLRSSGISTHTFGCPDFFNNKKQLNKEIFKLNILDKIEDKSLKNKLAFYYNSNLIAVKIKTINQLEKQQTYDIETGNHNFIANGLVVHNSAQRFERIREGAAIEFYKRIAELCNQHFLDLKTELKGILIGGPIPTKEEFHEGKYMNEELRRKVIGLKDMGDTGETGLSELVERSQDTLAKEAIIEEKQIMEKFFETLAKTPEKASYGKKQVEYAIELSAADTVLLSDSLGDEEIDIIAEKAEGTGANVKVISIDTKEGVQLKDLGGYAAILRYALQ